MIYLHLLNLYQSTIISQLNIEQARRVNEDMDFCALTNYESEYDLSLNTCAVSIGYDRRDVL
jgi:hypothetical protein